MITVFNIFEGEAWSWNNCRCYVHYTTWWWLFR